MSGLTRETVESELRTADDRGVPVLVTASTLTGDDGAVLGVVLTAADISERKRLEVELRHAQRLESIGQLAAGVAHEINTPIQFGATAFGSSATRSKTCRAHGRLPPVA